MLKIKLALAAFVLSAASPALADEMFAVTPSGMAEMLFSDDPRTVIGALSSKCIDSHWTVISSSETELVCESPMNMGQSILGQMLMGNSYSTPPRRFFRFNAANINGTSRIQASGWMELQMAFGQMKRTDFAGPEFQNGIMNFMSAAGGKYPVGTTFPNHVFMGFTGADATDGKYAAVRVTGLVSGSPAANAGIQDGDVITRIARKRFKNTGDYLDATAKAAESPTYEVSAIRAGKPITFNVARAFRPAWSEQVIAAPRPPSPSPQVVAPSSVADELGKLARLKQDGLLTEAEFDAQKKKLLGQ